MSLILLLKILTVILKRKSQLKLALKHLLQFHRENRSGYSWVNHTTATQQTKPEQRVKPSTPAKTDNQAVEPIKTPDITKNYLCYLLIIQIKSDYTRFFNPIAFIYSIKPQFTPEDLNRYSYRNNATIYNPLLCIQKRVIQTSAYDNFLLDIIQTLYSVITAILSLCISVQSLCAWSWTSFIKEL